MKLKWELFGVPSFTSEWNELALPSNRALELTSSRRDNNFLMTSLAATRALARSSSASSRWMLIRMLLLASLCMARLPSFAEEPFDVSLAHSFADLSPHYRTLIRRATERYRGDGPSHMITARMNRRSAAGFEIEEIVDYARGTTDLYLRSTSVAGKRIPISEGHFEVDPFPPELAPLRITVPVAARASNRAIKLAATRFEFTLLDD